jgi:hypothetical protein
VFRFADDGMLLDPAAVCEAGSPINDGERADTASHADGHRQDGSLLVCRYEDGLPADHAVFTGVQEPCCG